MAVKLFFYGRKLKQYSGWDPEDGIRIFFKKGQAQEVSESKAIQLLHDYPAEFESVPSEKGAGQNEMPVTGKKGVKKKNG